MTPFPPIERWRVPAAACELTRDAVMPAGRHGCECGAFWLGERATVSEVTAVVYPTGAGVEETPFYWSVAPKVYAAVMGEAARSVSPGGRAHAPERAPPADVPAPTA